MISKSLLATMLPNHLKLSSKKVLIDLLETMLEIIQETNPYVLDVSKIFAEPNIEMKKELTRTYLQNIFLAFNNTLYDDTVNRKIKAVISSLGIDENQYSAPDLISLLDNEYFMTSKEFKQKKGLAPAIEYAYNLMRRTGVQPTDVMASTMDNSFSVREGSESDPNAPFYLTVTGSLYKEIYEATVKQIAHPLGFGYDYVRLLFLEFIEYVNYDITYPGAIVQVICNLGINDYSSRGVFNILTYKDEIGNTRTVILFQDGTKLVKTFDSYIIEYDNNENVVRTYEPVSCELNLQYSPVLVNRLSDDIEFGEYTSTCEVVGNYFYKHPIIGNNLTIGHLDFLLVETPELRSIFLRIGSTYVNGFIIGQSEPMCSPYTQLIYEEAIEEGLLDIYYDEFSIETIIS